jgi:DNA-directed RNA polymerase specialized sigma24 family protein
LKPVHAPLKRIVSIIVTYNRVFLSRIRDTIERADLLNTRRTLEFDLPVSAASNQKYPDKAEQRHVILALRAQGWSYREIAEEVGLHWTRVGQIIKSTEPS